MNNREDPVEARPSRRATAGGFELAIFKNLRRVRALCLYAPL